MTNRIRAAFALLLSLVLILTLAACAEPETTPVEIDFDGAVVSYLGPEGTYTQEACGRFFEHKGTFVPYSTVDDAVAALVKGESDYAVIPQENTIGGAVTDYVDTLISTDGVSVVGEVELPINQNLLVYPGAELKDVKTVYSHKQGLTQGRAWLSENLPDAEVIEVASTAEGAKTVAEKQDPAFAAIASAASAEVYGLEILAQGIQNNKANVTRFYVLSTDKPATAKSDRLAFLAKGDAEDLPALLAAVQKEGVTLVSLHDRPLKTELGEYCYVLECEGCGYKQYQRFTKDSAFDFRYLGSFAVK